MRTFFRRISLLSGSPALSRVCLHPERVLREQEALHFGRCTRAQRIHPAHDHWHHLDACAQNNSPSSCGDFGGTIRRMGLPNWALFFMVPASSLGPKKTWNLENTKNKQNTQGIDQECMLFKACAFRNLLLALGQMHITKMQFFSSNWVPFMFRQCFLPFSERSKKRCSAPEADVRFWRS